MAASSSSSPACPAGSPSTSSTATTAIVYYYAHLDRYAEGLKEGMVLRRGDLVGYVGSTGNATTDTPHLHFAVLRLGPARRWWEGTPVNPYPLLVPQAPR